MSGSSWDVLFLCTGNSARSILAECLVNRLGEGRIRAWSAGSQPKGAVHPLTLEVLENHGHETSGPGDRAERLRGFERVYGELERRIQALARLPITSLDRATLRSRIDRLGDADTAHLEER